MGLGENLGRLKCFIVLSHMSKAEAGDGNCPSLLVMSISTKKNCKNKYKSRKSNMFFSYHLTVLICFISMIIFVFSECCKFKNYFLPKITVF